MPNTETRATKTRATKPKAKTATFVRELDGFTGSARLYRVSPPHNGHEWLVVSATYVRFSGPETYIFPGTADGKVASWNELDGFFRGGLDHEFALCDAGYRVAEPCS